MASHGSHRARSSWSQPRLNAVKRADLFARRTAAESVDVFSDAAGAGNKDTLATDPLLRLQVTSPRGCKNGQHCSKVIAPVEINASLPFPAVPETVIRR